MAMMVVAHLNNEEDDKRKIRSATFCVEWKKLSISLLRFVLVICNNLFGLFKLLIV